MKASTNTIIIICILILASACRRGNEFRQRLAALDSILISTPDSVYHLLTDMESDADRQSHADRMYYNLLRADAQNKAYIDFTTDSVMLKVAEYYDRHGSANEQMRAHYLLGCTYRDLHDVPMELQCFQYAVEKADTTQKNCDLYTLVAIYGQMADIYHSQLLPEEELKVLKDAEDISLKDKDMLSATKFYELRLRPYYLLNNQDSVLSITKNARNRYLRLNNRQEAAQLLGPAIGILISWNAVDSACRYMDIFERESGYIVDGKIVSTNAKMYYRSKGRMSLLRNQLDSAKYYYTELLNAGWKEAAYEGFVQIYKRTNDIDSLAKYASCFVRENDSARINTNSEVIAQMTAMYDYSLREIKNKNLLLNIEKEKNANKTMTYYVILISLILLVIIVIIVYSYKEYYWKNKQKLAETITRYNSIMHMLKENEHQKMMLERELAHSQGMNDEIATEYQQRINALKEKIQESNTIISTLRERYTDVDFNAWIDNFLKDEVVYILKEHLTPHSSGHIYKIDDNMWAQVYSHFTKNAYSFISHIKKEKYGLNEIDIKVIMLTTLGFRTNDIALLLDKSNNHTTNIRKRITEKLFNKEISARKLRDELLSTLKSTLEISIINK